MEMSVFALICGDAGVSKLTCCRRKLKHPGAERGERDQKLRVRVLLAEFGF